MNGGKVLWYGILAVLVIVAGIDAGYVLLFGLPGHQDPAAPAAPQVLADSTMAAIAVTPTETPAQHSIYMYSTARGYRYHEEGFVCTEDQSGITYLSNSDGLVGIICETGYVPDPPSSAQHSIYMYSTARGYQFHDAGFVCTDNAGKTYVYRANGDLLGIWCEW